MAGEGDPSDADGDGDAEDQVIKWIMVMTHLVRSALHGDQKKRPNPIFRPCCQSENWCPVKKGPLQGRYLSKDSTPWPIEVEGSLKVFLYPIWKKCTGAREKQWVCRDSR